MMTFCNFLLNMLVSGCIHVAVEGAILVLKSFGYFNHDQFCAIGIYSLPAIAAMFWLACGARDFFARLTSAS